MIQKLYSQFSLWLLIAFNLYFIWYYHQHPDGFKTLLLIYWFQSVMIGLFTFLQLLTTPAEKKVDAVSFNDTAAKSMGSGCGALFFAVHYGTFHLVYLVFIAVRQDGPVDFLLLKLSIVIILLTELMEFIRKKQRSRESGPDGGVFFFLPYLRIIPMHLMLVGAAFWELSDITIFLVLKTIADVGMHLLTNRIYFRQTTA